ncbi:ATP-binding protein [Aliarcobacter vitoriensis]|uniref:AAA family ATPase n=1 Tax=Aliarcobacter vitoriensis TaxID=2011099 RepID=A0A366MUQ9_9BACT|nr:ATP-binding protein [Aliarcobacter vitoriensis]RBQ29122.1 AAA family ATPase [Aliarcobacter vitoriensis]
MNNVIISQNKHWESEYDGLYERDIFYKLIDNLKTKQIQVLQGVRRSGKSSLFKLLINHLCQSIDKEEILYLNLDDPFFIKYSNNPQSFYEIIQTAKKLTQKDIKYLFLDEVQAINSWEKYVKSVYDSNEFIKIFVTGSNSSLLNTEFSTLLTGRYLSTQIYPLKFKEILKINQINSYLELNKNLPKVLKIVDDMLLFGSFVEVYEIEEDLKRDLISSYYETILLKDCVANNQIRDIKSFKELSFYSLTNLTSLYSYSSLSKVLKLNDKSIKEYIWVLESCYLFSEIKQFSYSLKEQMNNKKKLYLCDNGFMNLGYSFSSNYGKLLENLTFSELQKRDFEIYFYNKDFECDFIVKKDNLIIAIQVCYQLNEQNKIRELNGLMKLPFKVDEKYIITYRQNDILEDVKVVPFWEYFFE